LSRNETETVTVRVKLREYRLFVNTKGELGGAEIVNVYRWITAATNFQFLPRRRITNA
jgi:hypothetical protein